MAGQMEGGIYSVHKKLLQYVPRNRPWSEPKKNRVQESVRVQESCTITLPWTLFMSGQKADWFIL